MNLPRFPLAAVLLLVTACPSIAPEDHLSCPCSTGWSCCQAVDDVMDVCVEGGTDQCLGLLPLVPTLHQVLPANPTRSAQVELIGEAEPGTRVQIFIDPWCAGEASAEIEAAEDGSLRVPMQLPRNAETRLFARAVASNGYRSGCSRPGLSVVEDETPPHAPVFRRITPDSPSSVVLQPLLSGTAEPGSRVQLYGDGSCQVSLGSQIEAQTSGVFEVTVSVLPNSRNSFTARSIDVAGNESPCSATQATYEHVSDPPRLISDLRFDPVSPGRRTDPELSGTVGAGQRVLYLHLLWGCRDEPVARIDVYEKGDLRGRVAVRPNQATVFWGTLEDREGGLGRCELVGTYVHDDIPSRPPTVIGVERLESGELVISGIAEPNMTISVADRVTGIGINPCGGTVVGETRSDLVGEFQVRTEALYGPFITATARDAAGNGSGCTRVPYP